MKLPELTIASQRCTNTSPKGTLGIPHQDKSNIEATVAPDSACWARILPCFGPFQASRFRIEYLFRRDTRSLRVFPQLRLSLTPLASLGSVKKDFSMEVARGYLSHLALPSSIHTMLILATRVRPQPCTG